MGSRPGPPRTGFSAPSRRVSRFEQALDRNLRGLEDADRRLAHELAAGVLRTP